MHKILAALNALCLLAAVLCASIEIPTFTRSFYRMEYDKYHIPERIRISRDDLMTVTDKLLRYMQGRERDLVIETTIAGERREFFNQREKDHMVDVKNLFIWVFRARVAALSLFVISMALLLFGKRRFARTMLRTQAFARTMLQTTAQAYQITFLIFIGASALLIFLISRDFDRAFTLFHHIFFHNELWILDPSVDLLINIVPLEFFMDIAGCIGISLVAAAAVIVGGSSVYLSRKQGRA
jgi:integral membrane protein (TIGR01906 family)